MISECPGMVSEQWAAHNLHKMCSRSANRFQTDSNAFSGRSESAGVRKETQSVAGREQLRGGTWGTDFARLHPNAFEFLWRNVGHATRDCRERGEEGDGLGEKHFRRLFEILGIRIRGGLLRQRRFGVWWIWRSAGEMEAVKAGGGG